MIEQEKEITNKLVFQQGEPVPKLDSGSHMKIGYKNQQNELSKPNSELKPSFKKQF